MNRVPSSKIAAVRSSTIWLIGREEATAKKAGAERKSEDPAFIHMPAIRSFSRMRTASVGPFRTTMMS